MKYQRINFLICHVTKPIISVISSSYDQSSGSSCKNEDSDDESRSQCSITQSGQSTRGLS